MLSPDSQAQRARCQAETPLIDLFKFASPALYVAAAPLLSLLNRVAPNYMTTTEQVGRAMIKVARDGFPRPVLESEDINRV